MWIKWKHIFKLRNSIKVVSQTSAWGNFLMVQWVGLGAFSVVAPVQSLVGELRFHKQSCGENKKQTQNKKSAWISSSFMWSGFHKVTKIKPVYMINKVSRKSLYIYLIEKYLVISSTDIILLFFDSQLYFPWSFGDCLYSGNEAGKYLKIMKFFSAFLLRIFPFSHS